MAKNDRRVTSSAIAASFVVLGGCAGTGDLGTADPGDDPDGMLPAPPGDAGSGSGKDAGGPDAGSEEAGRSVDASAGEDAGPGADGAAVVEARAASELGCAASAEATVEMRNTGTTSWSRETSHRLVPQGDASLFYERSRVRLPAGTVVAPGASHLFSAPLTAPAEAGAYVLEWQMRSPEGRFGEVAAMTVSVTCAPGGAPDPSEVTVVHPTTADAPSWPVDHTIAVSAFREGQQEWSPAAPWPGVDLFGDGKELAGNLWIVRWVVDRWEATPVEWFFEGMTRQFLTAEMIDENKNIANPGSPIWPDWDGPSPGERLYFFLSTPAWHGTASQHSLYVRTNLVEVEWGM